MALYLNVFVARGAGVRTRSAGCTLLAPTRTEPPFAIAQGAVLLIFIAVGIVALVRFRPPTA